MNPLVPIGLAAAGLGLYAYHKKSSQKSGAAAHGVATASSPASAYQTAASWHASGSVTEVQHALNQLGATPPLEVDGVAGPKTIAAVKSFQKQAGITVDGIVGPETDAALEHAMGGGGHAVMGYFDDEGEEYEYEDEGLYDEGVVGASVAVSGFGESDWSAPDVAEINRDPRQREQIGLMQLWKQKAEAAFGPGTAYAYAQPAGVDVQGSIGQATSELEEISGGELGGVNLVSGGDDWSAPDIEEAYADPEQAMEMYAMAAHSMPYGYAMPYGYQPPTSSYGYPQYSQPQYGYPQPSYQPPMFGAPAYAPNPIQGTYPYGPMNVPAPPMPTPTVPGTYPYGPATVVPGQGYEFQSQAGRRY